MLLINQIHTAQKAENSGFVNIGVFIFLQHKALVYLTTNMYVGLNYACTLHRLA